MTGSKVPQKNEPPSPKWMLGLIACGSFIASAFLVSRNGFTPWQKGKMALTVTPITPGPGQPKNDIEGYGWYFYKAAFPTKNGSTDKVFDFMSNYTGGSNCDKVPLGCDGWKITCTYGAATDGSTDWDRVLHYVHAPRFFSEALDNDKLGVDGWQDVTVQSLENMDTEFSAFMHNKVQLFIQRVAKRASILELNGYKVMRRLSLWKDGKTLLAHASTEMSGKIWEFVGFAPGNVTGWKFWSEDECIAAHRVTADVYKLQGSLKELTQDYDDDDIVEANPSYWISIGVAASTENNRTDMWTNVKDITGAQVSYDTSSACRVATIAYKNTDTETEDAVGDETIMKIVTNYRYQAVTVGPREYSLKMYEDYITEVHKKYLQPPHGQLKRDRWRNWDHWLDQHVGLKWKQSDGCHDKSKTITSALLDKDIPVGKRAIDGDGDHYYSGYSGMSMCIEYNTEECHFGIGETDVCACSRENSNRLGSNYTSCDMFDDVF